MDDLTTKTSLEQENAVQMAVMFERVRNIDSGIHRIEQSMLENKRQMKEDIAKVYDRMDKVKEENDIEHKEMITSNETLAKEFSSLKTKVTIYAAIGGTVGTIIMNAFLRK